MTSSAATFRRMRLALLASSVVLLTACGSPWVVLQRSGPPAALRGVSPLPISFDTTGALLDGDPLDVVIAGATPEQAGDINDMILHIEENFLGEIESNVGVPVQRLVTPPGPGETRLVGHVVVIERGSSGPMGAGSRLVMRFDVVQNGMLVDSVQRDGTLGPSITRPSIVQRLTHLATSYGRYAARFYQQEQGR